MSATFVVREEPTGVWVLGCCDDLHGYSPHFEEFDSRNQAEKAATEHRRRDKADRLAWERRIAECCRTCGKPR